MNNEIRNELLLILELYNAKTNEDKDFKTTWLLERFEEDIKRQLEDIEYKQKELKNNLELVDFIKKQLNIK